MIEMDEKMSSIIVEAVSTDKKEENYDDEEEYDSFSDMDDVDWDNETNGRYLHIFLVDILKIEKYLF